MAKLDLGGLFKTAGIAFLVGVPVALVLGFVSSMLASLSWVMYILYGIIVAWAVPKLPRDANSIFDILILTLIIMGISGIVGMFVPGVTFLQWASLATVMSFLTTLVTAIIALVIAEEYLPI